MVSRFYHYQKSQYGIHPDWAPEKQADGKLSKLKAKDMIMKAMKEGSNLFEWTHKGLSGEEFPATVLLTRLKLKEID